MPGVKRGRGGGGAPPKKLAGAALRQSTSFWAKHVHAKMKALTKAGEHPAKVMLDQFGPGPTGDQARLSLRTMIQEYAPDFVPAEFGSATWPLADGPGASGAVSMTLPLDAFTLTRAYFAPPHEHLQDIPQLIIWENWFQDILTTSHGGWEKNIIKFGVHNTRKQ